MLTYQAPERDLPFLLFELFELDHQWQATAGLEDCNRELAEAVLAEAAKVAGNVLAPLNQPGDAEGCRWDQGQVFTPEGFAEAFAELAGGGWLGLSGNPAHEGQGLPKALGCLVEEMFWAANTSLYLYGTLTVGASICIDAHGSPEQKAVYLPKLYSGAWTGAMALTEAHAGSDLGIMRSRATPAADGSYRLEGSKIFITAGEHDLTDNIVHLVLARLPDAPAGSRGISLFIVPKWLEEGGERVRNGWASGAIEDKMGIHGSATNVIHYDGAVAYLLGEENQGLAAMFTMMNYERLSVGLQGLGAGELAYQQAARYARERLQGRAPSGPRSPDAVADSLLVHPDVRRMLQIVAALNEGGRALAVYAGAQLDLARHAADADERARAQARSELLTPITKAFFTDRGFECAVLAQQVFGGHGYVREWGMEQIVRDARIGQIYEGTNGIQAMDLINRKVLRDGGATLFALLDDMLSDELADRLEGPLREAVDLVRATTKDLIERAPDDVALPGAVATDYLDLLGYTLYGWLWARMAARAGDDAFGERKRTLAVFYFERLLPRTRSLAAAIGATSESLMALDEALF